MGADDDQQSALEETVRATPPARLGAAAQGAPGPGTRVGRYVLETRVGAGGMGVVWAARDPQLDRAIAIKLVHPALVRDPEAAARLLREARAMAKVSHRNVVAIHDAGQDGDQLFIAMELVRGTNLGQQLARRSDDERQDWRRWLAVMIAAGRGLAAAHGAGVIHRDFKPENVLVDADGRVCVGDFGVAELGLPTARSSTSMRSIDVDSISTDDDLTTTGALVGTPAYMSPEQLRGGDATKRSDQFAFCVTAWEALYGCRPFVIAPAPGEPPVEALRRAIERDERTPEPPNRVPRRQRDALLRGLAADPDARWPALSELLAELEPPRRRWTRYAAGALAVAAAAVGIAVVAGGRNTSAPDTWRAERRFAAELKAGVELSGDGRRVAMVSADAIVVRALRGPEQHTLRAAPGEVFETADFVGDELHLAVRHDGAVRLRAWNPDSGATRDLGALTTDRWLGHVTGGELFLGGPVGSGELYVQRGGQRQSLTRLQAHAEVWDISPDGGRVVLVESGLFDGRLVVVDLAGARVQRSEPIVELTGAAWADDRRLLYTSGTVEQPAIHEVAVGDGFGPPRLRLQGEFGWFGQIAVSGRHVVFTDSASAFRARMFSSGGTSDLDPARVAAAVAWLPDGGWLAWSRTTGDLERRSVDGATFATIETDIHGEPGNATRAGDIVILSMRRKGGRELSATSLADGKRLWTHPVGATVAARCAADDRPPCFAIVAVDGQFAIRALDPAAGTFGADELFRAPLLTDLAVSPDGRELLISDNRRLHRLALAGGGPATIVPVNMTIVRGVAYHPAGGHVVAGSVGATQYPVLWVRDGVETQLARGESELLFMPRPSPAGDRYLIMSRLFLPALFEVTR